jgi:hypothetical protein
MIDYGLTVISYQLSVISKIRKRNTKPIGGKRWWWVTIPHHIAIFNWMQYTFTSPPAPLREFGEGCPIGRGEVL